MGYPVPSPILPAVPVTPPEPPKKRRGINGGALVHFFGWLILTALIVFCAIIGITWETHSKARSAALHSVSVTAPITEARSLKTPPDEAHEETQSAEVKPAETAKTTEPAKETEPASDPLIAISAPSSPLPVSPSPSPPVSTAPALAQWPRSVSLTGTPEVNTVSEDEKKSEYIYHTDHFEFCCDAPVGPDAVRHFARVFEATWLLNCQLPLDLRPAPETMRKWFRARILSTDEAYTATGAPNGSAGYYSRSEKTIFVPISSLGMKLIDQKQKRVMTDHSVEANDTLIHEITHQMMSRWLPKLPVWFSEGSAEYTGMSDFVHGRFFLSNNEARLKTHLRSRSAQQKGPSTLRFAMLKPSELLALDHGTWANGLAGSAGSQNYASALLLTYFLYHLDGDSNAAKIVAWLRAIEVGTPSESAFRATVLADRTVSQLEVALLQAYRKIGIEIDYTKRGGPEYK